MVQYTFFIPFYVLASVMIGAAAARWLEPGGRRRLLPVLLVLAALPAGVYEALPAVALAHAEADEPGPLPPRSSVP